MIILYYRRIVFYFAIQSVVEVHSKTLPVNGIRKFNTTVRKYLWYWSVRPDDEYCILPYLYECWYIMFYEFHFELYLFIFIYHRTLIQILLNWWKTNIWPFLFWFPCVRYYYIISFLILLYNCVFGVCYNIIFHDMCAVSGCTNIGSKLRQNLIKIIKPIDYLITRGYYNIIKYQTSKQTKHNTCDYNKTEDK